MKSFDGETTFPIRLPRLDGEGTDEIKITLPHYRNSEGEEIVPGEYVSLIDAIILERRRAIEKKQLQGQGLAVA